MTDGTTALLRRVALSIVWRDGTRRFLRGPRIWRGRAVRLSMALIGVLSQVPARMPRSRWSAVPGAG